MPYPSKLYKGHWNHTVFGHSALSEADYTTVTGRFPLKYSPNATPANGTYPIHLWQFCHNLGRESAYELKGDCSWAALGKSTNQLFIDKQLLGPAGPINYGATSNYDMHEGIVRMIKVNLMLYSRPKSSTTYTITFVKMYNEEMDPSAEEFDLDKSDRYWQPIAYKLCTSPAAMPFRHNTGRYNREKAGLKILAQFKYRMREQLSTEDSQHKRVVKFTMKPHHRIMFKEEQANDVNDENAMTEDNFGDKKLQPTAQDVFSSNCPTIQNIMMVVQCDDYQSTTEETSEAESQKYGHYDCSWETYWSAPRQTIP